MITLIFSVIIPAYNSEKWIGKSIESLINQTLDFDKNIEVIIVNDASSDNTDKICREYLSKYPNNLKYIENDVNKGPGASRNIGLKYATGE